MGSEIFVGPLCEGGERGCEHWGHSAGRLQNLQGGVVLGFEVDVAAEDWATELLAGVSVSEAMVLLRERWLQSWTMRSLAEKVDVREREGQSCSDSIEELWLCE